MSQPDPASLKGLRRHRVPTWWSDAKLGIFVHWTPAAVAGFAPTVGGAADQPTGDNPHPVAESPYAEWYQNSLRFPDSTVAKHHRATYGDRPYDAFADDFVAALDRWDPEDWADRFARAGARYVVLVTKHHDGFCLWPSSVRNPQRSGWHTERDLVGELGDAVRARGMRYGLYYSGGLDWTFDDRPMATLADVFASTPSSEAYARYATDQVLELIDRYRPSVLWNDICWPYGGDRLWRLFADYYAAVPDGVVNDRWLPRSATTELLRFKPFRTAFDKVAEKVAVRSGGLVPPKPPHFDVRTPEYTSFPDVAKDPFEVCRGMDRSFGFNRASTPDDFIARDELVDSFTDLVSKGGNLLLNVGPRGEDAQIPDEQQQRLDWLGELMAGAGPALVGTRPWVAPAGRSAEGHDLRFTARGDDVHVIARSGPDGPITLPMVAVAPGGSVTTAAGEALAWSTTASGGTTVDPGAASTWPIAITVRRGRAIGR